MITEIVSLIEVCQKPLLSPQSIIKDRKGAS